MASKTYALVLEGSNDETVYGSKKTAVKYGDESGKSYRVISPSGKVVHAVTVEAPEPEEPLFYEFLDFPGNYSIVTAPMAVEIAKAAGVPAKMETFPKSLTRRVHFGGPDMDRAAEVVKVVRESVAEARADLKVWQKENLERRRTLTDMQRYVEHREFIREQMRKTVKRQK